MMLDETAFQIMFPFCEYEYKIIQLIKILPKSYQTALEKYIELLIEAYIEETKDLTNK